LVSWIVWIPRSVGSFPFCKLVLAKFHSLMYFVNYTKRIKWNKIDKQEYTNNVEAKLTTLQEINQPITKCNMVFSASLSKLTYSLIIDVDSRT
jgi:hypothetical protein